MNIDDEYKVQQNERSRCLEIIKKNFDRMPQEGKSILKDIECEISGEERPYMSYDR